MDPFREKHPLSKKVRRLSRESMEVEVEKHPLSKKVRRLSRESMEVEVEKTKTLCEDLESLPHSRTETLIHGNSSYPTGVAIGVSHDRDLLQFPAQTHRSYGTLFTQSLSHERPEGIFTETENQRSRSERGNSTYLTKQQKETVESDYKDRHSVETLLTLKELMLKKTEESPAIREKLEHHESKIRAMKDHEQRNCHNCTSFNIDLDNSGQLLEDRPDETDVPAKLPKCSLGQLKCALNGELGKNDSLKIGVLLKFDKPNLEQIEKSKNPGLEVLHIMHKQGQIGPNCENLLQVFEDLHLSSAAHKLKSLLPSMPSSSGFQRPYKFETLIKNLDQCLDHGDAERVAIYCEFSIKDLYEVKQGGSSCLLEKLRAKELLSPGCVKGFVEVLESLNLDHACQVLKEYEQNLHDPVLDVKLTYKDEQSPSETESQNTSEGQITRSFIEDVFSQMALATGAEFDLRLEELNKYTKENYNLTIDGISKGSLILHFRVSSIAHLDQLLQSINSGEFAKACSRILFPSEELRSKGLKENVELTASYDTNSVDRVKIGLQKSECHTLEVRLDSEGADSTGSQTRSIQTVPGGHDHDGTAANSERDITVTFTFEKPLTLRWNVAVLISETPDGDFETDFVETQYVKYGETRFILFQVDCGLTIVGAGVLPVEQSKQSKIILKHDASPEGFVMNKAVVTNDRDYNWSSHHKQLKQKSSVKAYSITKSALNFHQSGETWEAQMGRKLLELLLFGNSNEQCVSSEKVSKGEDVEKSLVENQSKNFFDKPSACTLRNVFWSPCTDQLVRRILSINEVDKAAIKDTFRNNFNKHGVHMVPHNLGTLRSIKRRQKGIARKTLDFPVCDEEIAQNQYLSPNQKMEILRKRIADRTVDKAAVAVSKWASDLELDVFIFTNYQYTDYLKQVATATDINGKHDILVISREFGVIFIQVSSSMGKSRKVAKQQLQKKTQQLMKDKIVFLESNRDLSHVTCKIPVHQFAAFPNFCRKLVELDVCSSHSQSVLTKECFDGDNIFPTLNEKISIPSEPCLSEKDYQYLCSRYVGMESTDSTRTSSERIKATFKILRKAFLTSEQRNILDTINSFVVLAGDFGTGKSLILKQKACRFAKNEHCKPFLVSCADLQRVGGFQQISGSKPRGHLSLHKKVLDNVDQTIATFSIKFIERENAVQESFDKMLVGILKDLTQSMTKLAVLLEDFPFKVLKENSTILNSLLKCIPDQGHMWLSITTVSSTETKLVENLVSQRTGTTRRFKFFHLNKIMRMPKAVVNLYSSVQEFTSGLSLNKTVGHIVMGPKPMLFNLDVCSCKELDEPSLACICTKSRLMKVLQNIMKLTGDIDHRSVLFYLHSLTKSQEMFELLSDVMKSLNSEVRWFFEKESNDTTYFCVSTENAQSWCRCEYAVVISIDPFGMNHWKAGVGDRAVHTSVFSRCLSQYIHVVWPDQEAAELFEEELNALGEDHKLHYAKTRNMKENGYGKNIKSHERCLEYLTKADLFMAGPQYE